MLSRRRGGGEGELYLPHLDNIRRYIINFKNKEPWKLNHFWMLLIWKVIQNIIVTVTLFFWNRLLYLNLIYFILYLLSIYIFVT